MKLAIAFATIGTLALLSATSAQASATLSASTNLTSESQVLTTGTEVWGGRQYGGNINSTLADGVTFGSVFNNANFVGTSLGSGITVKTDGSYYGAHSNLSSFSDPNLNSVLTDDQLGAYGQIFVDGLTTGQTYVIQVFASMTNSGDNGGGFSNPSTVYSAAENVTDETQGGTTTFDYGTGYSSTGATFFTDTFTATGSQEYLLFSQPPDTSNGVIFGAIQVRELPEPSVYGMIGLGLLALVGIGRFRKLAA